MKISKYITIGESTKSQTATRLGINNTPSHLQLSAMQNTGKKVFDPLREFVGCPLGVSSFFRCEALNLAIGGSKTSQHRAGEAIDIDADIFGKTDNKEVFNFIYGQLDFDQLIWEFGDKNQPAWVHVSTKFGGENRNQVLRVYREKGKSIYVPFDLY